LKKDTTARLRPKTYTTPYQQFHLEKNLLKDGIHRIVLNAEDFNVKDHLVLLLKAQKAINAEEEKVAEYAEIFFLRKK